MKIFEIFYSKGYFLDNLFIDFFVFNYGIEVWMLCLCMWNGFNFLLWEIFVFFEYLLVFGFWDKFCLVLRERFMLLFFLNCSWVVCCVICFFIVVVKLGIDLDFFRDVFLEMFLSFGRIGKFCGEGGVGVGGVWNCFVEVFLFCSCKIYNVSLR